MINRYGVVKVEWDEDEKDLAVLAEELEFGVNLPGDGLVADVIIKAGFSSRCPHIPWMVRKWSGHPWKSPWAEAAVLREAVASGELLPRAACDLVFERHLEELQTGKAMRGILKHGCALLGPGMWACHDDKQVIDDRSHLAITVRMMRF